MRGGCKTVCRFENRVVIRCTHSAANGGQISHMGVKWKLTGKLRLRNCVSMCNNNYLSCRVGFHAEGSASEQNSLITHSQRSNHWQISFQVKQKKRRKYVLYCASSLTLNSLDLRTHTTQTFDCHYHKGITSIYNGQLFIGATFIKQLLS